MAFGLIAATAAKAFAQPGSFPADRVLVAPAPQSTPAYPQAPSIESMRLTPEQLLAAVIFQLQNGKPQPSMYGPAFWQTIMTRTGNTGYDQALAELGAVTKVSLVQTQPLPQGTVYGMIATHQRGLSSWSLAIADQSYRIEYGAVSLSTDLQPAPQSAPSGQPSLTHPVPEQPAPQPATPVAQPSTAPAPTPASEACRKFPNLC
jgi:hypothetical protein